MKILLFLVLVLGIIIGLIVTQWGMPAGVKYCNNLIRLSYSAETTGKIRYLHVPDFTTVAECGDICTLESCPKCPPEAWTCEETK